MSKMLFKIYFFFIITTFSCHAQPKYGKPLVDPKFILQNHSNFLKYYYPHLNLDEDFIALDQTSKIIDKTVFFESLLKGTFLPLKQLEEKTTYYSLYEMHKNVSEHISATIKSLAYYSYQNYKWEGKTLPGFNFTDIDNNKYDSQTTRGNIVVLKFWFIGCVPCVEEMPSLNELVKTYKENKNIIFLSLAFDTKEKLKIFLTKTTFNFKVVASQKKYLVDTLNIQIYPTHFILNKEGVIVKAVREFDDLKTSLQKVLMKEK